MSLGSGKPRSASASLLPPSPLNLVLLKGSLVTPTMAQTAPTALLARRQDYFTSRCSLGPPSRVNIDCVSPDSAAPHSPPHDDHESNLLTSLRLVSSSSSPRQQKMSKPCGHRTTSASSLSTPTPYDLRQAARPARRRTSKLSSTAPSASCMSHRPESSIMTPRYRTATTRS